MKSVIDSSSLHIILNEDTRNQFYTKGKFSVLKEILFLVVCVIPHSTVAQYSQVVFSNFNNFNIAGHNTAKCFFFPASVCGHEFRNFIEIKRIRIGDKRASMIVNIIKPFLYS